MRTNATLAALSLACIFAPAHAQTAYRISVEQVLSRGDVEGQITPFFCFPLVRVREGDASAPEPYGLTDAFVTLSNPSGNAQAFQNHPQNFGVTSQFRPDQATLLAELDGDWTVRIEETDGSVYEYIIPITYTLPFAELPEMVSDTLVEGGDFAPPFDARVEGGSASLPGPTSPIRFTSISDVSGTLEFATLSGPAPLWTPELGIPEGEDSVLVNVIVFGNGVDTTSWTAGAPVALTPGAPELRLDPIVGKYNASKRARLFRPATTGCLADFDGDGDVDLGDFGAFGVAFGSVAGDANYNPLTDFDSDGDVDLGDFGAFGIEFGNGPDECAG